MPAGLDPRDSVNLVEANSIPLQPAEQQVKRDPVATVNSFTCRLDLADLDGSAAFTFAPSGFGEALTRTADAEEARQLLELESLYWTTVDKEADESRSGTAVLANDGALTFSMSANQKYAIRATIFFDAPAVPGFQWALVGPAAPTLVRVSRETIAPNAVVLSGIAVDAAYTGAQVVAGNANPAGFLRFSAVVQNGANSGTFALQWAQAVANAAATIVYAGSILEWRPV